MDCSQKGSRGRRSSWGRNGWKAEGWNKCRWVLWALLLVLTGTPSLLATLLLTGTLQLLATFVLIGTPPLLAAFVVIGTPPLLVTLVACSRNFHNIGPSLLGNFMCTSCAAAFPFCHVTQYSSFIACMASHRRALDRKVLSLSLLFNMSQ